MTLSPLLRNIHKNKVTVVRWEDKQGNRSTSTYFIDRPLTRFVLTLEGYKVIAIQVVESSESDEAIIDWMGNNQALGFGVIV